MSMGSRAFEHRAQARHGQLDDVPAVNVRFRHQGEVGFNAFVVAEGRDGKFGGQQDRRVFSEAQAGHVGFRLRRHAGDQRKEPQLFSGTGRPEPLHGRFVPLTEKSDVRSGSDHGDAWRRCIERPIETEPVRVLRFSTPPAATGLPEQLDFEIFGVDCAVSTHQTTTRVAARVLEQRAPPGDERHILALPPTATTDSPQYPAVFECRIHRDGLFREPIGSRAELVQISLQQRSAVLPQRQDRKRVVRIAGCAVETIQQDEIAGCVRTVSGSS
ncbi:MAG: hypothetical protein ACOX5J_04090 [Candidatus Hydrogenedentales bacterium]